MKKFTIAVFIKTKMGAINFFKKVTNAAYLQILLFGNMLGILQMALERALKKKNKKKLLLRYLIITFKICGILDGGWTLEVKILNEDDEIYIVRD